MAYELLQQPVRINACVVPNRIVRTAHATGFARGEISPRLVAYHAARARGGVGLSFVEIAAVHPSSPSGVIAFHDGVIDGYRRLVAACQPHGMRLFQQLWHGGSNAAPLDGGPAWGPSTVPEALHGRTPVPMTQGMIDAVVAGFAAAARRCREGGLDGVEVHAAHGYLPGQFLSPLTNRRTDGYGGSLEQRTRFLREVLAAIRAAVGPGFPVGVRLSGTEGTPGGIQPDEARETAERLEAAGLVDFVNVSMGSYYAFHKFIGAMHEPLGYELPTSEPVTKAVRVPTIVTGRIMDLHDAERIVRAGIADLVSMVRATIADPEIVAKSFRGDAKRVRPCISCNQGCVGGLLGAPGQVACLVNPEAGFEEQAAAQLTPAARPRRVLVVGGGPAGLEAALTAARRGHRVTLCEAGTGLGGMAQLARRAPHREDMGVIANWLAQELELHEVEVKLGAAVSANEVASAGYDAVIVATGGEPRRDGRSRHRPALAIPGVSLPHVGTPEDVLAGRLGEEAERALVYDDFGHVAGVSVAEYLLARGAEVTFATGQSSLASELGPSLQADPYNARLRSHPRFALYTRAVVAAVTPGRATLRDLDTDAEREVAADLVVLETGGVPRRELYDALVACGVEAHLAGDALSTRDMQHAFASGRRAGAAV
jgi:2,4-dienoyl-CoA reductase-like NADH-dependent reductase (Old Yellow Enzyme family)/thioredoxin reductase